MNEWVAFWCCEVLLMWSSGGYSVFLLSFWSTLCVCVCTQPVLCYCCRHCAMTQGCSMLQHVMAVAAPRSSCQRRNTTGRTCTSGKTWCLAALASICPADCSFSPLTASSQPVNHPLPLSSSLVWALCLQGRLCCCWAGVSCSILMPWPVDQ